MSVPFEIPAEFKPGVPHRLSASVQRVVAPNASMMTGPGTNSYVIGDPPLAIVDPGPPIPAHIDALLRVAPRVETVFVTHTHGDHSPGARDIAARTGARLIGVPPPKDGYQDMTFAPQLIPQRDQTFAVGALTMRAIDTPGHASNHVCWLLEQEGMLFSGDHLLDGVTPVILPPDGDMAAYIDALRRLSGYRLNSVAPGHGRLLPQPYALIDGVIAHRLKRESKVVAELEKLRAATLDELVVGVYDDVPVDRHTWAKLSLEAHLLKLAKDGRCRREGDRWHAA